MPVMLMKLGNSLSDWLGILMNLRLAVLILTSDPLASLIMFLLCAKFVVVLIMKAIIVPIIFLIWALLDVAI